MPVTMVIGAQWGDEGKGRAVDWLASHSDVVARFAGGDNAGHTVYVGDTVFKMHLIPSGILRDNVVCVLGNGMVINPLKLLEEIDTLQKMGVDISPKRLLISTRAHIITPGHIALDAAREKMRGAKAIGTTLRGIGPTYLDKTGRTGIRTGQMLDLEHFTESLEQHLQGVKSQLATQGLDDLEVADSVHSYVDAAERLRPYLHDTMYFINQKLENGATVLVEGAQGTLLDVDHGSYPYVTSSSTTSGGALSGLGIGPKYVEHVYGVVKAFSTRVGAGPMPTELFNDVADHLRGTGDNFWDEFGTTTGRQRRCGWLDAVMLRYSLRLNGFTDLVVTKLDILSGLDELKIAVSYALDDTQIETPPGATEALERAEPMYETLPGWQEDVSGIRRFEDLPQNAQAYIQRIETLCNTPVRMISVGPERDQLILR